ncbi:MULTISPECIES: formate dehydrogenase subunit delta [Sphingobium]|jgi:formate dehydrogenase subunit delta|uniref:Formate dehydrogenase subunit delta n=1 Tax=Sphingobium fuliginis (strain ATCC 27551) TaxID=336203 RepID=A0A4Q4IUK5_SPHSA|nr:MULTISPECIES: formate dehydrogenase subunit delta [Sphingobium]QOT73570.1 formate dehydrogenase subunit delta [Sphingobium fuliginis]RYL97213.1 formate dehydrogenase [Sphingobium fuliginis]WDA35626.1 formate dehydrogenase subunit delta [Sphingobium sp. YC-XJ3]GFZ96451.1 formate dehydrogenase subunit delta [Sphingobium fuliginis]
MSDENEVMSTEDRLIYMANQIARNVAALGEAEAVAMTADHIRAFWDPAMKQRIALLAAARPGALSPIAAAAVGRVVAL